MTHKLEAGLIVLIVFLSFFRLGETKFWHDESEVGMVGKQILLTGLPLAADQEGILPVALTNDFHTPDSPHLYRWQTWLMFYVAAAGMVVGGTTELAARIPFVCIGLFTLVIFYLLVKELLDNARVAKVATFLLGLSAQYLILIRDARYYSLIMCFGTLSLFFFLRCMKRYFVKIDERKHFIRPETGFLVSMVALFYSHYLSFYGFAIAFGVLYLGIAIWKNQFKLSLFTVFWLSKQPMSLAVVGIIAVTTPWLLFFRRGISGGGYFSFWEMLQNAVTLVTKINRTLPVIVLLGGVYVLLASRKTQMKVFQRFGLISVITLTLTSIFLVAFTVALHLPPSFAPEFRYVLAIYPLLFIFLASALLRLYDCSRVLGTIVCALVVGTNVFVLPLEVNLPEGYWPMPQSRYSVRSYLYEFIGIELKNGYAGPVDAITAFLDDHGQAGDNIFTTLEALPLKFHFEEMYIDNSYTFSRRMNREMTEDDLLEYKWVIFRHACSAKCVGLEEIEVSQVLEQHFTAHTLNSFDYIVNNREEIPYHFFASPLQPPHIIIYERKNVFSTTKNEYVQRF